MYGSYGSTFLIHFNLRGRSSCVADISSEVSTKFRPKSAISSKTAAKNIKNTEIGRMSHVPDTGVRLTGKILSGHPGHRCPAGYSRGENSRETSHLNPLVEMAEIWPHDWFAEGDLGLFYIRTFSGGCFSRKLRKCDFPVRRTEVRKTRFFHVGTSICPRVAPPESFLTTFGYPLLPDRENETFPIFPKNVDSVCTGATEVHF